MALVSLQFTVNGRSEKVSIPAHRTLLEMLREDLHLTGAKEGCGNGECGACTVIVDGRVMNACLVLAAEVDGKSVLTIEGLKNGEQLHPVQQAFVEHSGMQCGFCTPGFLLSAKTLLDSNPHPTREEIKEALLGNFCRCTGYTKIVESVEAAARAMGEAR
jgi:aerobic carbon-monoxide dehydrogenase small subunit